jgi:hypothetical protein
LVFCYIVLKNRITETAANHPVKSEKSLIKNKNTGCKGRSVRRKLQSLQDDEQSTQRKLIIQEETAGIQETIAKVYDTCPLYLEMKAKVQEKKIKYRKLLQKCRTKGSITRRRRATLQVKRAGAFSILQ